MCFGPAGVSSVLAASGSLWEARSAGGAVGTSGAASGALALAAAAVAASCALFASRFRSLILSSSIPLDRVVEGTITCGCELEDAAGAGAMICAWAPETVAGAAAAT